MTEEAPNEVHSYARVAPEHRVDWNQVLLDLSNAGLSVRQIGALTGIPYRTLDFYKNRSGEPRHADGERVLVLWCEMMGSGQVPLVKEAFRQRSVR